MTGTTRRSGRLTIATVSAVLAGGLLAGCAEPIPEPRTIEPFEGPVLTADQENDVVMAVAEDLDLATERERPGLLRERVTGPALEVRRSQIQVAEVREDDSLVTQITPDLQQMIIPTTSTWPRTSYVITEQTEDLQVPRFVAYEQAEPRENYKMWGWVQIIPGATMPQFADAELIGSEELGPDDESLTMTPREVLAQYADLVTLGTEDSEAVDSFELPEDGQDLVRRVQADARNVRTNESFEEADGSYRMVFVERDDQVKAIRTADGGAVVMGVLDGHVRISVEDGGEIPPFTATQQALLDGEDTTNELYVEYVDMVALWVPAADSDEPVRPIGYQHVAVSAANEIPGAEDRSTFREEPEDEDEADTDDDGSTD